MQLENITQPEKEVVPFIGLRNMGNTCYLNSILQVLYYCPYFENKLSQVLSVLASEQEENDVTKDENQECLTLIKELQILFSHLHGNQQCLLMENICLDDDKAKELAAIRPESFLNSLRKLYPSFEPFTQQDAQECFHCILSLCKSAISQLKGNYMKSSKQPFTQISSTKIVGGRKLQLASILGSSENKKISSLAQNTSQIKDISTTGSSKRIVLKRKYKKEKSVQSDNAPDEKDVLLQKNGSDRRLVGEKAVTGCFDKFKHKQITFGDSEDKNVSIKLLSASNKTSVPEYDKENVKNIDEKAYSTEEPPEKKIRIVSESKSGPPKIFKYFPAKFKHGGFLTKKRYDVSKPEKSVSDSVAVSGVYKTQLDESRFCEGECVDHQEGLKSIDFVKDLFQGELVTTTRCMECESKVNRSEMFQDISLPVKNTPVFTKNVEAIKPDVEESCKIDDKKHLETCNLSWALSQFTLSETLIQENKYFCNVCQRLSEGERNMLFKQLPPVLTFHLKRFSTSCASYTNFSTSVSKITSAFEIPSSITFAEWCSTDCKEKNLTYELFGIVVHSGTTITSGHYLSYVKYRSNLSGGNKELSKYDGRWLEVDDEQVRLLSEEEIHKALTLGDFDVASRSPYMLFYQQL